MGLVVIPAKAGTHLDLAVALKSSSRRTPGSSFRVIASSKYEHKTLDPRFRGDDGKVGESGDLDLWSAA